MAFDICIVGAGLWGTAAARCASVLADKVCLIGPVEPNKEDRPSRDIFASHYDAGRNVRKYQSTDHILSLLTMRTFKSLGELEESTGVTFKSDKGHIISGSRIEKIFAPIAKDEGIFLTADGVRHRYPFLDTSGYGDTSVLFPDNAGHVNPRRLVWAQQKAAIRQHCRIIDDVVESVEDWNEVGGEPLMRVLTKNELVLYAKKVLLCTGLFTQFKNLLPPSLKLDLAIDGTFTVKLEVGEGDLEKLCTMPSLASFSDLPERDYYIVPPVRYPDGKFYVKIGPQYQDQSRLSTLKEVKNWFLSQPDPELVVKFRDILLSIVKGFNPVSVQTDMCACTRTPTGLPYCDMLSPRLGLAIGGNGYGAMISDEMGRMAAEMIAGEENWNRDIPREELKARYLPPSSNL